MPSLLTRSRFLRRALRAACAGLALYCASAAWGQALTGLSLTSDAGSDGAYKVDDLVEVTASFDVDVVVDGNPVVRLLVGKEERSAGYWSGRRELRFRYTVVEGDLDEDGISIGANRLDLNGGSITDEAGNEVMLTHDAIENQEGHRVDGIPPVVLRLSVISDPGADKTYTTGDEIQVGVLFSEPVAATSGTPALPILIGERERLALYQESIQDAATFAYVVRAEDQDEDGLSVDEDALVVGGKGITDAAGNPAVLTHEALEAEAAHKVAGVSLPITGIEFVSDAGAQDTYRARDVVRVAVLFSSPVWATGQPTLRLQIGDEGRTAAYEARHTDGLLFTYTVVNGDLDEDGISIERDSLALGGGTIVDASRNPVDLLRHPAVVDQARHKVDAARPFVADIAIVSDAGEDGRYPARSSDRSRFDLQRNRAGRRVA